MEFVLLQVQTHVMQLRVTGTEQPGTRNRCQQATHCRLSSNCCLPGCLDRILPYDSTSAPAVCKSIAHKPPAQCCEHCVQQVFEQDVPDILGPSTASFKCNEPNLHKEHQEPTAQHMYSPCDSSTCMAGQTHMARLGWFCAACSLQRSRLKSASPGYFSNHSLGINICALQADKLLPP